MAATCIAGCASTPDLTVAKAGTFSSSNGQGYPTLQTGNTLIDERINQQLQLIVESWSCPNEDESQFNLEKHALNEAYLSVEYSAMVYCDGMPSPSSTHTAVTYSLADGSEVLLPVLTQCESLDRFRQKNELDTIDARVDGCPVPQYSGNYFIEQGDVTLLNFYPSHADTGCEFEVVKALTEFMCK